MWRVPSSVECISNLEERVACTCLRYALVPITGNTSPPIIGFVAEPATEMYELIYWPSIVGRGDFIRIFLEESGEEYKDTCRFESSTNAALKVLQGGVGKNTPPYAVPVLKDGDFYLSQTSCILAYLGEKTGNQPDTREGQFHAQAFTATIMDFIVEAHNCHHPIAIGLYYEDQKAESQKNTTHFLATRVPKYFSYFEEVLKHNGGEWLVGSKLTYADTSLLDAMLGMLYAFPKYMATAMSNYPKLTAHVERMRTRPRIADYLKSSRRPTHNTNGTFRHYPELDFADKA